MQTLLKIFWSGVLLTTLIGPVASDELPFLNVLPLCRGVVSQSDTPLEAGVRSMTIQECVKYERVDRETIKEEWSTFSASEKRNCVAEATMGGESSYTDLLTCLEIARDVKKMKIRQSPVTTQ
jgi:hypothetical protein